MIRRLKRRAKQRARQMRFSPARSPLHAPAPTLGGRGTAPPPGGPVTLRCAHCRRPFTCSPSAARTRRYDSLHCARTAKCRPVAVDCLACGRRFRRSRQHVNQETGRGMCCGRRCRRRWTRRWADRGWATGLYVRPIALRKADREVW